MPTEPDANLIQQWQHGDRAAFEQLVRAWEAPLGRFLYRLVQCPETAQDLLQELFLKVHQQANRFRDQGQFRPWIYRIALNLARDHARKMARHEVKPLPREDSTASSDLPSDIALSLKEQALRVQEALRALPEAQREVVVLRHYEDLSFEAMARLLDTPSTTLKSRFQVAMKKLEQELIHLSQEVEDRS